MLQEILGKVWVVAVVIAFFGVTVFVHEFGHFVVARLCGMVVEVFSIGFGPALWKKRVRGVTYKIGVIPFGGYVALPQLDPTSMAAIQGTEDDAGSEPLPRVSPWLKILVSMAGAAGNIVLAVLLAWIVYWVGMPATTASQDTVIGYVDTNCVAYVNGVRIGDTIYSVNGARVAKWSDFVQEASLYEEVLLHLDTPEGVRKTVSVPTDEWEYGMRVIAGVEARGPCVVEAVAEGMSAEQAGVTQKDVIRAFAGAEVMSPRHLIALVNAHGGEPVSMTVARVEGDEEVEKTFTVTPEHDPEYDRTRIGIVFATTRFTVHPWPADQIRHHSSAIFRFLKSLVTPKKARRAARLVGGPVAIVSYYVGIINASLMLAVWFTGFLNVNLAVINLLPLPVLDGGHIVFSLWEVVTRRPPRPKVVNVLVNLFAVLLIGVFVLLSLRDLDRHTPLGRLVRRLLQREPPPLEDVFEPDTEPVPEPQ